MSLKLEELLKNKRQKIALLIFTLIIALIVGRMLALHVPKLLEHFGIGSLSTFEKTAGEYDGTWTTHTSSNGQIVTAFEAPEDYQNEVELTKESTFELIGPAGEKVTKLASSYNPVPGNGFLFF